MKVDNKLRSYESKILKIEGRRKKKLNLIEMFWKILKVSLMKMNDYMEIIEV